MSRSALKLCVVPLLVIVVVGFIASALLAQEEAKPQPSPDQPAEAAPGGTHKIVQAPFKIEVELSGVFAADQMWPVALQPETYSSFTVIKAVPPGKRVQKGETLVWLDTKDIDQQLQDLEYAKSLNKLSQQQAKTELELLRTTLPLDLEAATRAKKTSDEDLSYFLETDKAFEEESAEFSLKSSQESLEYAQEELNQLEKMYNADDLTEETEEIVLRRARNDVERSKFYLKSTELRTKKALAQDIPRAEQALTESAQRADIALAKAKASLPAQLEKQQLENEKLALSNKRTEEQLKELMKDREMMKVPAPAEGYVYYGRCTRGKWAGVDSVASQLEEGGKLPPNNVFMTIVNPRPLHIRVEVPEKDLYRLNKGLKGKAVPTGFPDLELEAVLEQVAPFPLNPGVFDGHAKVTLSEQAKPVVPGMNCKLTFVAYEKSDAIAVPASAVFEDDATHSRDIVYVKKGTEAPEKRKVVIGQKTPEKWEIVQGLQVGEEILLTKPDA